MTFYSAESHNLEKVYSMKQQLVWSPILTSFFFTYFWCPLYGRWVRVGNVTDASPSKSMVSFRIEITNWSQFGIKEVPRVHFMYQSCFHTAYCTLVIFIVVRFQYYFKTFFSLLGK